MATLYEYAVIKNAKRDRDGEVIEESRILIEPGYMLAKDVTQVNMKLARELPEEEIEDAERITILVRPF